MRFDREKAFEFRRDRKSYKEISLELGMSLSTLSNWFKDEMWSGEIKRQLASRSSTKNPQKLDLMHKARREKLARLYETARREAEVEYHKQKQNPLFIAGLMIYWGEGDKMSKYRCGIANTEPLMIKIFARFLSEICNVDKVKIKIWLLLYPDLDDLVCKKYWSETVGLESRNFSKSITIHGRGAVRRLSYGVCNVAVHNRYLKEKMLAWLRLAAKDLATSGNAGIV